MFLYYYRLYCSIELTIIRIVHITLLKHVNNVSFYFVDHGYSRKRSVKYYRNVTIVIIFSSALIIISFVGLHKMKNNLTKFLSKTILYRRICNIEYNGRHIKGIGSIRPFVEFMLSMFILTRLFIFFHFTKNYGNWGWAEHKLFSLVPPIRLLTTLFSFDTNTQTFVSVWV